MKITMERYLREPELRTDLERAARAGRQAAPCAG